MYLAAYLSSRSSHFPSPAAGPEYVRRKWPGPLSRDNLTRQEINRDEPIHIEFEYGTSEPQPHSRVQSA